MIQGRAGSLTHARPAQSPIATDRPTPRSRVRSLQVNLAIVGLAGTVLWFSVRRYYPFIADDALISLRYAERLVDGHGLTWTNGSPVEGYSNLLWVLLLAGVHALGVDLIVASRIVGVAATLGSIAAIVWWSRSSNRTSVLPGVAAGVGVALAGPIAVWSIGGLEQPLVAVLLTGATILVLRESNAYEPRLRPLIYASALYGLLCLTRPDEPIMPAVACVFLLVANWHTTSRWRAPFVLGVGPAICVVGQEIFRLIYYHDSIPNTAYAKVGLSAERVASGFHYVVYGHVTLLGLLVPAITIVVLALLRRPRVDSARRRRVSFLALSWATSCAYVSFIGGDLFPGYRHLVEGVIFLALLSVEFWQFIVERVSRQSALSWRSAVVWACVGASFLSLGLGQVLSAETQRAVTERWEWDCRVLGRTLKAAFQVQQPLFAVDTAGCAPYFSQLPSLDMYGLNDRYLAHHRPPGFGTGDLGHELGSGPYVLSRRPDLVLMCSPNGRPSGCGGRSSAELAESPAFHEQYRLVWFYGTDPYPLSSTVWVRTSSPRIGVRMESGAVIVPGYLIASPHAKGAAYLAQGNTLVAAIPVGATKILADIPVPAGTWHLDVTGSPMLLVSVKVTDPRSTTILANGDVHLDTASTVAFVVHSDAAGAYLQQLTLIPS